MCKASTAVNMQRVDTRLQASDGEQHTLNHFGGRSMETGPQMQSSLSSLTLHHADTTSYTPEPDYDLTAFDPFVGLGLPFSNDPELTSQWSLPGTNEPLGIDEDFSLFPWAETIHHGSPVYHINNVTTSGYGPLPLG